jgi:hypothetical protein
LLPNGLRIDDIGEHGSGAILATHNPNIDPELNKYNKDRITQDAGCARVVDTGGSRKFRPGRQVSPIMPHQACKPFLDVPERR